MNNESRIRGFNSWQAHEGWRTRAKNGLVEGARANRLVATLICALWEVGLDRRALIPRGTFLAVVAL